MSTPFGLLEIDFGYFTNTSKLLLCWSKNRHTEEILSGVTQLGIDATLCNGYLLCIPVEWLCVLSASDEELQTLEPEYITIPGWCCDISKIRSYADLPRNAVRYIEVIEEALHIPGPLSKYYS